ncbi:MAG TPA: hypothetical protein VNS19_14950 [Acidimicrobiales bacterium]|jgi:UDP-N-acetylmuramyl pentapeptide phosphotransferase/UDP-N-acetylglucosamine-1-phosphate transferase|nr:hypothetical protein [Acidimicrobiales bacterium]
MRAGEVEAVLKRIGRVFILGLVLQPRISGQAVLLPLFGALMVWALFGLDQVAATPEGRRGLRNASAAAVVVTLLGIAGWLGVEPGGLSLVVLFTFVAGVLFYAAFVQRWCVGAGWGEPAEHLRRARINLVGVAATTAVAVGAVVALADRPLAGTDPDWWNLVVGREVGNGWVIGFFLLVFIGWVGACVELERGAKALRGILAEHPDAEVPTA